MQASILVLEPEIRRSIQIRRALECRGHHLLFVPSAAIALGALRHVQFDILLAPVSPLTISAAALSAQAKLLQPRLRVLILDELELGRDLLYSSVDAHLRTPISDAALVDAVRALLARSDGPLPASSSPEYVKPADEVNPSVN
jgi:CheY-like chemotaxis protein